MEKGGPGPRAAGLQRAVSSASCLQLTLEGDPETPDHTAKTPHSPLYADPYTPPATSHHKVTDVRGLDEVSAHGGQAGLDVPQPAFRRGWAGGPGGRGLESPALSWQFLSAMQSSFGPEPPGPFPSVPVTMPVSNPGPGPSSPHVHSKKWVPPPRASQRPRGSAKGRGSQAPDSPQLVSSSPHPGQGAVGGGEAGLGPLTGHWGPGKGEAPEEGVGAGSGRSWAAPQAPSPRAWPSDSVWGLQVSSTRERSPGPLPPPPGE